MRTRPSNGTGRPSAAPPTRDQDEPTLVTDVSEQLPYAFEGAVRERLGAGDYSVAGLQDRVAIERKTRADAYRSLGCARGRFERELERLAGYDYAAIVVECSLEDFLKPPPFSELPAKRAITMLLGMSVQYGIAVFFAGDRQHGEAVTRTLLDKFAWCHRRGRLCRG